MNKMFRCLAICTIGVAFATLSIAWAQSYTTVDYPGASSTLLDGGPNPEGVSVGTYFTSGVAHGFAYYNGVFTSFDPPGSTGTFPFWINPQGIITGIYMDGSGVSHGFVLSGGNYTTVDYPGAAETIALANNPSGEYVGGYCVDSACSSYHSFIRSKHGQFTSFDPPGALGSSAFAVNPSGAVCGYYNPTANPGLSQGYVLRGGAFTTIAFSPGVWTYCGAINPAGTITGGYLDSGGVAHGYIYYHGVYTSFDVPGSTATFAIGINPSGIIVGYYFDFANVEHGFVRTP
jgi:hypothetical protein